MLRLLERPMNVTELIEASGLEQSAVSHHLKRLLLCHFVDVKQNGKERMYSVNKKTAAPLFRLMEKHVKTYCCKTCNHVTR